MNVSYKNQQIGPELFQIMAGKFLGILPTKYRILFKLAFIFVKIAILYCHIKTVN